MRFIFEYVTCCMMMSTPCNNKENSSSQVSPSSSSKAAEDETRSLVAVPPRSGQRRKRMPTRGSSADWQPSLFAISEDNAATAVTVVKTAEKVRRQVATPVKQQPPSSSQRNVKRCGVFSGRVNDHSRSYDFSRDPIPMVVPTFSAAPFMF
ncbi:hypothetical protein RND81_12G203700 [Saponaria officinalis]|uniref:Uncharacterized protein n=1 Tax=Saponaria officinalis TaxID=3572 RepID=A0AAW1HD61_SAPOF